MAEGAHMARRRSFAQEVEYALDPFDQRLQDELVPHQRRTLHACFCCFFQPLVFVFFSLQERGASEAQNAEPLGCVRGQSDGTPL